MRNSMIWTIGIAAFGTLAGCATGSSGGQSSLYSRLPTGVTLLDTDTGRCTGSVQVREEQNGKTHDQELLLKPGENATFTVDVRRGDELAWSCIGDSRSVNAQVDCPDATSHVRISRRADGPDLALECYGNRASR